MPQFLFATWTAALTLAAGLLVSPAQAADAGAVGAAVTVVKAKKGCFSDTIAITGVLVPREEVLVLPEREGLQISAVQVEAGDIVRSGQILARLVQPDAPSGTAPVNVTSPVAGIVLKSSAVIGTTASARAEPMFQIIAHGEFELMAQLSSQNLSKLSSGQLAKINVVGVGEITGRVRLVAAAVDGMSQMGQVRVFIGANQRLRSGAFGHARVVTGESCGLAIPLSALLYGQDSTVVAVVRNDRIETRQVVAGLMDEGEVEIREGLTEGDLIVARAGAFVREGDRVRPVVAGAAPGKK